MVPHPTRSKSALGPGVAVTDHPRTGVPACSRGQSTIFKFVRAMPAFRSPYGDFGFFSLYFSALEWTTWEAWAAAASRTRTGRSLGRPARPAHTERCGPARPHCDRHAVRYVDNILPAAPPRSALFAATYTEPTRLRQPWRFLFPC